MPLTAQQKATVSTWIAAGDNLSMVQRKLRDDFKISMTYIDVRFLVDDLNLTLKDPAPKADVSDVSKAQAGAQKNPTGGASTDALAPTDSALPPDEAAALSESDDADLPLDEEALPPAGPTSVTVTVDKVTLIPGAIAGGTVKFSDGVTGKWIVDQQYRPGFTEVSQPGYRPNPADAQAFMQELSRQLQSRGF